MAPPRLLGLGFIDNHSDGLDPARRQPLRGDAEPARLRLADRRHRARRPLAALVVEGASGSLWPAWVWFAVMASGNHFWLDCLAGAIVALFAMAIVYSAIASAGAIRRARLSSPSAHGR